MDWYLKVLKNYAVFTGRARRKEFWMFVLMNFIIGLVLAIIGSITGTGRALQDLYSLAVLFPNLAVSVRRLHDIGRSGWWLLIGLIPLIGAIVLLIFWCTDSDAYNDHGPNPKDGE